MNHSTGDKKSSDEHVRKFPFHIALIMDGNRRWAQKEGLPIIQGHHEGAQTLQTIVEIAAKKGVKILTVFAFSTENWQRPRKEIRALFHMLTRFLLKKQSLLVNNRVCLETVGDSSGFPFYLHRILDKVKLRTQGNQRLKLVLALNYGGRDEIVRAVNKIVSRQCSKERITEQMITDNLDTNCNPDPDLLIRTSGEMRLSNFMLWQLSYTEIYFTTVLWPEFTEVDFEKALAFYASRMRRLGR